MAEHRPYGLPGFPSGGTTSLRRHGRPEAAPHPYRYDIERYPDHAWVAGPITLAESRRDPLARRHPRVADLASSGWYGGHLQVHRPNHDVQLLMLAEDLHVAPVTIWWSQHHLG